MYVQRVHRLQLMQQMAGPVRRTEAHLALTSILTGLLLVLHRALFSQPQYLTILKMWVSVQPMVTDTRDGRSVFHASSHV